MTLPMTLCVFSINRPYTVNQQILAAVKFGVSQNKVIWCLPAARLCSVRSTYILVATNISENTQFAKYNSTPKFVDLQYTVNPLYLAFPYI